MATPAARPPDEIRVNVGQKKTKPELTPELEKQLDRLIFYLEKRATIDQNDPIPMTSFF